MAPPHLDPGEEVEAHQAQAEGVVEEVHQVQEEVVEEAGAHQIQAE